MKIYINTTNDMLHAFEDDGSQDFLITDTMVLAPLDANGKPYSKYAKDINGNYVADKVFLLEQAKTNKITSIDSTTAEAIIALVGDDNKQKAKLAEHTSLARLEVKGKATATQIARLDELDNLNLKVMKLKADGNEREQKVNAIKLSNFKTLQDAIKAIEAL